jgi:hypothetical protein
MPISGENSKRKRSKRTTKKSSRVALSANASVASLGSATSVTTGDHLDDTNSVIRIQVAGAAVSTNWYITVTM